MSQAASITPEKMLHDLGHNFNDINFTRDPNLLASYGIYSLRDLTTKMKLTFDPNDGEQKKFVTPFQDMNEVRKVIEAFNEIIPKITKIHDLDVKGLYERYLSAANIGCIKVYEFSQSLTWLFSILVVLTVFFLLIPYFVGRNLVNYEDALKKCQIQGTETLVEINVWKQRFDYMREANQLRPIFEDLKARHPELDTPINIINRKGKMTAILESLPGLLADQFITPGFFTDWSGIKDEIEGCFKKGFENTNERVLYYAQYLPQIEDEKRQVNTTTNVFSNRTKKKKKSLDEIVLEEQQSFDTAIQIIQVYRNHLKENFKKLEAQSANVGSKYSGFQTHLGSIIEGLENPTNDYRKKRILACAVPELREIHNYNDVDHIVSELENCENAQNEFSNYLQKFIDKK